MQSIPEDSLVNGEEPEKMHGSNYVICRLEDICLLPKGRIAIADHSNGILIMGPDGKVFKHLNGENDTLAYSVNYDESSKCLLVLILDRPGWRINFYTKKNYEFQKSIPLPEDPDVSRMKLRWVTAPGDGQIIAILGHKIFSYNSDIQDWTLMHSDFRKDAWFSCLRKLPTQGNRFLVCYKGESIQEVRLDSDGLSVLNKDILPPKTIKELGSYTVDNGVTFSWQIGKRA